MARILVLGGHGFMGKNLQATFLDSSHEVFYESRRTSCNMFNLNELINKIKILAPEVIINAAANVGSIEYVTKFAADVVHDNSIMYINLYKAVSEVDKSIVIINAISNCSYPGIIDIQEESDWWLGKVHPSVEAYGIPKKLGFIISECYKKQHGINTVNLIIPNAYGPFDYCDESRTHAMNGIIMRMIKAQKNKDKTFTVWGSGTPIREWIYMFDVARIIKEIIDNKMYSTLPNPINLGQEYGVSILETVETVKTILNYDVEVVKDTNKQDGAPIKILGKKLFTEYFPDFKFTNYTLGIENTINYYKNLLV
jgi:GDP-L-fucose synthase